MRQHAPRAQATIRRAFVTALCSLQLLSSATAAVLPKAVLFGTRETYSADLASFTKWNDVVRRTAQQSEDERRSCRTAPAPSACPVTRWQALIAELRGLPERARIDRVNAELNRIPYVSAGTNWHDPNHWETPFEFLARGGQCEDYAIAKLMALAASGIPEQDLRLVVVRDRERALDHAVTVVFLHGTPLLLDNQSQDVTAATSSRRYVPYYSINFAGWWHHQPQG